MLRVEDYLTYLEEHTYPNEQPRVVPSFQPLSASPPTERARRVRR